jgi:hypothetical protein
MKAFLSDKSISVLFNPFARYVYQPPNNLHPNGFKAFYKEIMMKQWRQGRNRDYKAVTLTKDAVQKKFRVHILVAKAFLPNPENLPQVNHKDLNPSNNHVDNLEWITNKDNQKHSWDNGRKGVWQGKTRGMFHKARRIRCTTTNKAFDCIKDAAEELSLSSGNIVMVLNGQRKHTKGLNFEYLQ